MNDTATKGGALIWIETMMHQLATHHLANGMDKILMVEVFETVLVRIMDIGVAIELMSQGILGPIFITSILGRCQNMWNNEGKGLTQYSSSLNMKGVMAQPWLVWTPACPQTQTAAQPMPRWSVVPGMVQKEEGI